MDYWVLGFSISVFFAVTNAQTAPVETCFDSIPNCQGYISLNKDFCTRYEAIAKAQCSRSCQFCTTLPPQTTQIPTTSAPTKPQNPHTTAFPGTCTNKWENEKCGEYDPLTCHVFVGFFSERCAQFCGYCDINAVTSGFHGKCMYKEKVYEQGESWYDGCDYECVCKDGKTGKVECQNRCPAYYNVPPQCVFIKKEGECCLQPVCNFGGILHVKTIIGKGQDKKGNAVCMKDDKAYEQGSLIQDDCKAKCQCTDAALGKTTCHDTCPEYDASRLPSNCYMHREPGTCCDQPRCKFDSLDSVFTGTGTTTGRGIDRKEYDPNDILKCKDLDAKCPIYGKSTCTGKLKPYMTDKCPVYCGLCEEKFGQPKPKEEDKCFHQGLGYKTGDVWRVDCEHECVCDDQLYGYYHCYSKCPQYKIVPKGCTVTKKPGSCCSEMICNARDDITFSTTNIVNIGGGDHVTTKRSGVGMVPVLPPVKEDGTISPDWEEPKGIVGCLHNGRVLVENEISSKINCSDVCQCIDEHLGKMVCYDRCSEYEMDESCTLVEDPNDPCCKIPKCPESVTEEPKKKDKNPKTVIGKVVRPDPSTITNPTNYTDITKTTPNPDPSVPTTEATLPESANPPPKMPANYTITGKDKNCIYNNKVYAPGQRWIIGCKYNCLCIGGANGNSVCLERCKRFVCPYGKKCTPYVDKSFPCCSLLKVEEAGSPATTKAPPVTVKTTQSATTKVTSPKTGSGEIPQGWLLLMKGVSGVPGDLYQLWTSAMLMNHNDKRTQVLTPDHPAHFKSVYAERFKQCRFEKIRLSIYRHGLEKARVIFNAANTDKTSWFDESRIESSSWSDVTSSKKLNLKYENTALNRQFEVYKSMTSACAVNGWMFVSTVKGGCDYQTKHNDFHYSPLSGSATYGQMEHGDVFAIMAKGGLCDVSNPHSLSCTVKNKVYLVGEQWQVGCSEKCSCSESNQKKAEVVCEPLCETHTNLQPGCKVVKKPGECCGSLVGETCYGGGKCWDKFFNQTRAVGEIWRVDCQYDCDCSVQEGVGYVTKCTPICPTWDLSGIPDCVTPTPRPGKCCALPVCPGVEFELPDKYKKDF